MSVEVAQPPKVELISINQVEITDRLHIFDEARVLSLSDDMEARGLMSPILLRKMPNGVLRLVAGRHRLAAAQSLGWEYTHHRDALPPKLRAYLEKARQATPAQYDEGRRLSRRGRWPRPASPSSA